MLALTSLLRRTSLPRSSFRLFSELTSTPTTTTTTAPDATSTPAPTETPIHSPNPVPTPPNRTQPKPVYILPYYGASDTTLASLPDSVITRTLRAYGGLIRERDTPEALRERLRRLTNASLRPSQLTIAGVVVSDRMNKSIVIASRRPSYSKKLRKSHFKTRRFMAHDEFDLCREGDRVVIRSCRLMSRSKAHVVVQNFGSRTGAEGDDREERMWEMMEKREEMMKKREEMMEKGG